MCRAIVLIVFSLHSLVSFGQFQANSAHVDWIEGNKAAYYVTDTNGGSPDWWKTKLRVDSLIGAGVLDSAQVFAWISAVVNLQYVMDNDPSASVVPSIFMQSSNTAGIVGLTGASIGTQANSLAVYDDSATITKRLDFLTYPSGLNDLSTIPKAYVDSLFGLLFKYSILGEDTATNRDLSAGDFGLLLHNSTANEYIMPLPPSLAVDDFRAIEFEDYSTGSITVNAGAGVVLNNAAAGTGSVLITGKATLRKIGADTYHIFTY